MNCNAAATDVNLCSVLRLDCITRKILWIHFVISCSLLNVVSSASLFPTLENTPTDLTVYPGDNVMFECDLRDSDGFPIIWYHHESNIYIDEEIASTSRSDTRFRIAHNATAESFKLWVMDVQFSDAGTYSCVWRGACSIPMAWMFLTVVGAPTLPDDDLDYTLYSSSKKDNDDDHDETKMASIPNRFDPICEMRQTFDTYLSEMILICKSPSHLPQTTVEWYRNGVENMTGPFETNVAYQRPITQDDTKNIYTCIMRSNALATTRNCSVGPISYISSASVYSELKSTKNGNAALAAVSVTLAVLCGTLIVVLIYILRNKRKGFSARQQVVHVGSVSDHITGNLEGYMALETPHQTPQYQPLKPAPNGRMFRKPTVEPPPRKSRSKPTKPNYKPPLQRTPSESQPTYAIPNVTHLSVNIPNAKDEYDSDHSYEFPS